MTDNSENAQLPSNSKVYEDGELWSFIRRCMSQGKDIHLDHAERTYEEYSARLDLAALERLPELQAYIVRAVVSARGSSETPPTRHLHCIGYSPTLSGFGVREGSPEGELIATFKRQADADEYIRRYAHETRCDHPDSKCYAASAWRCECGALLPMDDGVTTEKASEGQS